MKVTPRLVSDLVAAVGADNVLSSRDETIVCECDGHVVEKSIPDVVVFPTSTEQVVEVVKLLQSPSDTSRSSRAGPAPAWPAARSPIGGGFDADDLPDAG